jgi:diguanylate cyclase (GGDEF)-like protein/PAS domain S-box-containing protein
LFREHGYASRVDLLDSQHAPERLRLAIRESELRSQETAAALRRFRTALDSSADMILLIDVRRRAFVDFNDSACQQLGYTREELLKRGSGDIRIDQPSAALQREFERLAASVERSDTVVATYRRKDGSTFPVEVRRRVHDTPEGPILVVNARDLTERKAADERQALHLRYQETLARFGQAALGKREPQELIAEAIETLVEGLGADAVVYVEPGPQSGELVLRAGKNHAGASYDSEVMACAPGNAVEVALASSEPFIGAGNALPFAWARALGSAAVVAVRGDNMVRGALCALSQREDAYWADELGFLRTAASLLSTGLQRIDSERRLAYLAQFDPLTGLANRTLLVDRFSQMIVQAKRRATPLGVLFVDLDDFKLVNDRLGHAAGDVLLAEVALRLQSVVRSGDTVARISGDEFVVVLADLARTDDAAVVAQKILDRLAEPVALGGEPTFVTASIGIAAFPGDGENVEALLGAADAAMYRAKQSGRNAYQFYTTEITQRTRARGQLAFELRRALERSEFALAYQPKFNLTSGKACGAEALLRWMHPERGPVSPAEFIPVLEDTGLIVQVGEWVIRRACEDLKGWIAAGRKPMPVAVNLSARQFRQKDLDARIRGLIAAAGIDPALIELEITESQLMEDPEHAIRIMQSLRDSGTRIAIDDFGTGYSSLAYLTRFPVGSLKIDRSFVADVFSDNADAAIVRTIIQMAHQLGFTVIAEGVETDRQAAFLRQFGCEQAQGFLFARPMAAADVSAYITSSAH